MYVSKVPCSPVKVVVVSGALLEGGTILWVAAAGEGQGEKAERKKEVLKDRDVTRGLARDRPGEGRGSRQQAARTKKQVKSAC